MNSPSKDLYTLRRATAQDAATLARHRCDMWLAMQDLKPESYEAMYRQCVGYFQEAVPRGEYHGWLACTDAGEIVAGGGLLLRRIAPFPDANGNLCPSEQQAHILNVFTEPAHRGNGLARRLMETILAWCKAENIGSVTLNASSDGKPLYQKLHFAEVPNFMKWTNA